jgi:putative effector of murein hydrolase LrgA (UPF0299 family)
MALGQATPETTRGSARRTTLAGAGAVALAVLLWGGYSRHWPWTGINGRTATLWDWMHLLLLPLAVAVVTVWSRRDTRVHPRSKLYAGTLLALLVVVVILGYVVPWAWTGFRGNTLWDWFNLIFLPLTLVLIPRFVELRDSWERRHTVRTAALAAIFLALVIGGYVASWRWTGFTGNTLWKWMNLLFLPLLVPTVILPAFTPIALRRVIYLDENGTPIPAPTPAGDEPAVAGDEPPVSAAARRSPPVL